MNYIKLLFLTVFIACVHSTYAQVIISPGSVVSVMPGSTISLSGDLAIQPGGFLNSDGSIQLQGGNFYDTGTVVFTGNSQLVFNGSAPQTMYTAAPLTVASLALNNANGLTPNNSITITNNLVLTNGIYFADTTHPLFFADTALDPVETNTARIEGRAIMSPRAIGTTALSYLGCNISFGADLGSVSVARTTGPDASLNIGPGYSIAANWLVNATNGQQTPNRNIGFSWLSALDNGRDMTEMYLYGSDVAGGSFSVLNDTATDVSATDPRVYNRANIGQFGRLFTLSDNKPLAVTNVTAQVTKVVGFPNPFSNVLNLSITKHDNDAVHVQIMDMAGHVVLNNTYNAGNNAVVTINDMGKLAGGTYLLHVYNDNFANTIKLVKTN